MDPTKFQFLTNERGRLCLVLTPEWSRIVKEVLVEAGEGAGITTSALFYSRGYAFIVNLIESPQSCKIADFLELSILTIDSRNPPISPLVGINLSDVEQELLINFMIDKVKAVIDSFDNNHKLKLNI